MFEKMRHLPAFVPKEKKKLDKPCPNCREDTLYSQIGYSFISRTYLYTGRVEICEDSDKVCGYLEFMEMDK